MKSITIGIVAEGGGDCVVLSTLINKYLEDQNLDGLSLQFKSLQPYVDNTSRSGFSEGGWEQVYKWCLANPPQTRADALFGLPLFADDMDNFNCSALLVHMDADICRVIGDKTSVVPVPAETDASTVRGVFIENVLNEWLWPEGPEVDSRYIVVPAVESIESWLVAGLSEEDADPEGDRQIQRRLAELDYIVVKKRPVPKNIKSTNKAAENFRIIAEHAVRNLQRIVDRCPHFASAARNTLSFVEGEMAGG